MLPKEILEELFDEKKAKILKFFINNPDEKFYLRELGRANKVPPATTYRILNQLVGLDIINIEKIKKTKLYILARNAKTEALRQVFEEKKSAIEEFVEYASTLEGVYKIILHGQESKDKTSILVVGKSIDAIAVKAKVGEIKEKSGITIIDLTLTPDQFQQMSVMGLFPGKKTILWSKSLQNSR